MRLVEAACTERCNVATRAHAATLISGLLEIVRRDKLLITKYSLHKKEAYRCQLDGHLPHDYAITLRSSTGIRKSMVSYIPHRQRRKG